MEDQSQSDFIYANDQVAVIAPDEVAEPRGPKYTSSEKPSINGVLEMLSQRWTASVLCSLKDGIHRFNAISRRHNINPNTLKTRLRDLESVGVVLRIVESTMPPKVRYELTEKGVELATIFEELHAWVDKYEEDFEPTDPTSPQPNVAVVMLAEDAQPYDTESNPSAE